MPLDDREQRILDEIERQFYEQDPKLAETVRTATIASLSSRHLKWAVLGFIVGAGLMFGFFTRNTLVALIGFALMVVAVVGIVAIGRRRSGISAASERGLIGGLRRRWRGR
jgi:NADH:ubiquinone oxidoreductase subunit 2 (subunit N)